MSTKNKIARIPDAANLAYILQCRAERDEAGGIAEYMATELIDLVEFHVPYDSQKDVAKEILDLTPLPGAASMMVKRYFS